MPRHRIEAPRQRTLWPAAGQSARRVLFRAAGRRQAPSHAKPAVAPEWRRRLTRSQRRMLQRAGRRLLVSPWFAAGAGFVIATGVIIYTPHASLKPAISVTHCQELRCTSHQLTPQVVPPVPAGNGAPVPAPGTSVVPRGTTFWYQPVDYSTRYGFSMWIKIQAPYSTGQWRLSFVIRGASEIYVFGAPHWEPYGTDGVTVSNLVAVTESAGYAPISGQQDSGDVEASRDGYTVLFQIRGIGTPDRPSQCSYNGAACRFRLSNDLAPTR